MRAKKFVLIGDAKQLQPVVKSNRAIELQMQKSVFERLSDNFPDQKVSLKKQYRMNQKIMNLSNQLVYEGKLELALPEMKNRRLCVS